MYNAINMVGYILMDKMNSCPPKKKSSSPVKTWTKSKKKQKI